MRASICLAALLALAAEPRRERLVVDEELRRRFDQRLAEEGEEAARAALSPGARPLFDRYLAMRRAGRALAAARDLDERSRQVRALRREYLGDAAAAAMFSSDDAELDAALARRRGVPALTAADAETLGPLATMQREAGLSPDDVQSLRARTFGAAGAARLAALDQARAAWRARVSDYCQHRAGGDRERLLAELFTPEEQLRVTSIENTACN